MYPTDLTDSQWQIIEKLINNQRKRRYPLRDIVNALIYILSTGCQWRQLPHEYPPFRLVHYYFRTWTRTQLFQHINTSLLAACRVELGDAAQPSLAILDAQTVKNSEWGLRDKGYDGYKKIKGRKRHIVVDKNGFVMAAVMSEAQRHDSRDGYALLLTMNQSGHNLKRVIADSAYRGKLQIQLKKRLGITLEIVKGIAQKGFEVKPKRWIVERTFSFMNWS